MMKKLIPFFLLIGLLFAGYDRVKGQVALPAIFSDGMVLQQQSEVAIWGKSDKKTIEITTSWNNKKCSVSVVANGTWRTKVKTGKAGGPFTITISDGDHEKIIEDILLGEVWLASGQSNMDMALKGRDKRQPVNNSEEEIKNSLNPNIRFFDVKNNSWAKPLDDVTGRWVSASPRTSRNFSAVAYFFAKDLHHRLKVPVAIVQSAYGGTHIAGWMSGEVLSKFSEFEVKPEADSAYTNRNTPAGLFNAMIHPILGYGIKGALWYQGEHNRAEPELYSRLFPEMVSQWRKDWGIGDFPFYYVQLAPYLRAGKKTLDIQDIIPVFREMQAHATNHIKNSGIAILTDIGSESTVHPPEKEAVGDRLSYIALNKTYGFMKIPYSGPVYKSMKSEGNTLILSFNHAEGLYLKNKSSVNFEVAGSDRVFHPAVAVIKGRTVRVSNPQVEKPIAARYAFKAWVVGDLFNKHHLPASSFRTDDWPVK